MTGPALKPHVSLPERIAPWLLPYLACLAIFWPGLQCWFQQDDFAWLQLRNEIYDSDSLIAALFAPKAQGTMRPLSERVFFLTFHEAFGLDALPYRVWVFLTHLGAVVLLAALARRVTGSRLAAGLAALFWAINAALGTPLSWTSSYNQILCAAFLLAASLLFVRYTETRRRGGLAACWIVFIAGFGSLEINVVFPALAGAWAVLTSPRLLIPVVPMGAVSAFYAFLHDYAAPKNRAGVYALHFDSGMLGTLATYWRESFGGTRLKDLDLAAWWQTLGAASPWLLSIPLAAFLIVRIIRGERRLLFGPLWFVITLAPVLPLRDHISDYYLTVPTIGLALAAGAAGAAAVSSGWAYRLAFLALAGCYALTTIPAGRSVTTYNRDRSHQVRDLVFGVERVRQLHPGKIILLKDVSNDLFFSAVNDNPFPLVGVPRVFLTPGSEATILSRADYGDVRDFLFPAGQILPALEKDAAVVYTVAGGRLRNITQTYRAIARVHWKPGLSARVDVGHPLFAGQLGAGWGPIEAHFRWMGRTAVVRLRGPERAGERLHLSGYCPELLVREGPVKLSVRVDEMPAGVVVLTQAEANQQFENSVPVPLPSVGKGSIQVVLELDRVFRDAGGAELGLTFGMISVR